MPGPPRTIGCPRPALQPARIRRADQDGGRRRCLVPSRDQRARPADDVCRPGDGGRLWPIETLCCPEGATPSGRSPGRSVGAWMVIVGPVVLHGVIGSALITASRTGHFVGVGLITAGHSGGDASLNWPSLAVSIVAAAIALAAVIYSVKSTHAAQDSAGSGKRSAAAAERAAAAAEQQTEIQLQLRKGAAQPYVWV